MQTRRLLLIFACLSRWVAPPVSAQNSEIPIAQFSAFTDQAGLDFRLVSGTPKKEFLVETMGGGICVLDFDRDDWPDLFFVNGSTREGWKKGTGPSDALFRNQADSTFRDVTAQAGLRDSHWGMGCVAADYDGDGDTDLYLANFSDNVLYQNNGNGTFSDVTSLAGVNDSGWSTGAAFGDYDGDGDLDLYVANYVEFSFEKPGGDPRFCSYRGVTVACGPRGLPGLHDSLFRNEGQGRFSNVSESVGIRAGDKLYGFQPVWTDIDLDGDLDVFVANDSTPNFMWQNQGNGRLLEMALLTGLAYNQEGRAQANMGVDIQDVTGDGRLDVYSTNFSDDYHVLYRNGDRSFLTDISYGAKIAQPTIRYLGFGALLADFNNDGWPDIFAGNGHIYPQVDEFKLGSTYNQPNQIFQNMGKGEFREVSAQSGPGLALIKSTRGAVWLDFDRDGDLDLALSNMDAGADLLRNENPPSPYLQIVLEGVESNRQGIGARATVYAGEARTTQELHAGSGFLGNSEPMFHFGLAGKPRADRLELVWPSGKTMSFQNVAAGRIRIHEARGIEE